MTIYVPPGLPAADILRRGGHAICDATDIDYLNHPRLRIALINLMPDKLAAERQFARVLAATHHSVELILVRPESHRPNPSMVRHLSCFYKTWKTIRTGQVDGVIITGAPVEKLSFSSVTYWSELVEIMREVRVRDIPLLAVCWGAQAALNCYHGIEKRRLEKKAFGIFQQQIFRHGSKIVSGIGGNFHCPVSRHTEVRWADIVDVQDLHVAAASNQTGLCLVEEVSHHAYYMFNHLEYEITTLRDEYHRDINSGKEISPPEGLFRKPLSTARQFSRWHLTGRAFFANWIDIVAAREIQVVN